MKKLQRNTFNKQTTLNGIKTSGITRRNEKQFFFLFRRGFSFFCAEQREAIKERKRSGQIAVEFFLVAGFVLVLAAGLIVLIDGQVTSTSNVAKAAIAKQAVEAISNNAREVWLSGEGSMINQTIFVPSNAICFLYKSETSEFYCVVNGRDIVKSAQLPGVTINVDSACSHSGWVKTSTENILVDEVNTVNITCAE